MNSEVFANYPYYHIRAKKITFSLADRELLELQWQKMQFHELIEPRIEKAITVLFILSVL